MKKIIFPLITLVAFATSCLKDSTIKDGFDNPVTPATVLIQDGGLDNFTKAAIVAAGQVNPIVLDFNVQYANVDAVPLATDLKVTCFIDDSKRIAYNTNAAASGGYVYDLLPDSCFSFVNKSATIPAGKNIAGLSLTILPNKVDASKLYMLPIAIKDAQGKVLAANFSTIYFHIIGNPLAGTYSVVGTRYNCSVAGDQSYSGGPIPSNFAPAAIPSPKVLGPVSPTVTSTYVANLSAGTNRDYYFDINPAATTLQNIDVTFTQSFADGISNIRFLTKTYDPVTKKITLLWTYNNQPGGVGSDRIISEIMTKL
jgi:Domain of unknown function (DUF1735)